MRSMRRPATNDKRTHVRAQQQRLRRWLVMGGLLLAALALGVVTLVASVQLHYAKNAAGAAVSANAGRRIGATY